MDYILCTIQNMQETVSIVKSCNIILLDLQAISLKYILVNKIKILKKKERKRIVLEILSIIIWDKCV